MTRSYVYFLIVSFLASTQALNSSTPSNFWINTNQPRSRDILYALPSYHAHFAPNTDHASFFYNRTNKIGHPFHDRLAPDSLSTFAGQLAGSGSAAAINKAGLIKILGGLSTFEQKTGTVLSASRTLWNMFFWKLDIPIYISMLTPNLHKDDQTQLTTIFTDIISRQPTGNSNPTAEALIGSLKKVSSKWGVSDIRLQLGLRAPTETSVLVLGPEINFPISGLFRSNRGALPLGGKKLISSTDSAGLVTDLSQLINNIRTVSVHPTLGSNGHWGVGGFFSFKIPIVSKAVELWNIIRFTHFFPGTHFRILQIENNPPAEFSVNGMPGDIVHMLQAIDFKFGEATLTLGYDLLMQQKEKLLRVTDYESVVLNEVDPIAHTTPWNVALGQIKLAESSRPSILQHKLFAGAATKYIGKEYSLKLMFGGDMAVTASSLGRSYSLYISFEAQF